jgi:23S rRNA (guanine745-N1)-methyltransferase
LPLTRQDRTITCPNGHAYDVARSGYVNLLQPQDRRSRHAGDSKAAVDARARLVSHGVGRAIVDDLAQRVGTFSLRAPSPVVVDLGAGGGDALAAVAARRDIVGIGIDLSVAAMDRAARHFPAIDWVVANADRRLPLVDGCTDVVLSLHARRNPEECARVLTANGVLVVAIPASDDLVELREQIMGEGISRDRTEALRAEHASHFTLTDRDTVRERHTLDAAALRDLLRGTYRGERTSTAERVNALDRLDVTLASDVFVFTRR